MAEILTYEQCIAALEELGVNDQEAQEYTRAMGGGLLSIAGQMAMELRRPTNEATKEADRRYGLEASVAKMIGTDPEHVTARIEGAARAKLSGVRR